MRKFIIFSGFIIMLILFFQSYGQKQGQDRLDSLLSELPKVKNDTGKIKLLTDLAGSYNDIDNLKAIYYGNEALRLSRDQSWPNLVAQNHSNLGVFYKNISDYPNAFHHFDTAMSLYLQKGAYRGLANIYLNLGDLHTYLFNYSDAISWNLKALELYRKYNKNDGVAKCFKNIGNNYFHLANYVKALACYDSCIKIFENSKNELQLAGVFHNIGYIYMWQNNYDSGKKYCQMGINIARKYGETQEIINGLMGFTDLSIKQCKYEDAFKYAKDALDSCFLIGDTVGAADVYSLLGDINFHIATDANNNNFTIISGKTRNYLNAAQDLYSKCILTGKADPLALKTVFYKRSEIESILGEYKFSSVDLDTCLKIADSFFTQQKGYMFMSAESESRLQRLQNEMESKLKEKESQNKLVTYCFTTFGVSIFILCFILFWLYRTREKLRKKASLLR